MGSKRRSPGTGTDRKRAVCAGIHQFLLGNVIKCESIEELRQNRIGITADCVLYHSFRLQHINPENYTRRAYIGETSMRQRIRRLEEKCESLQEERIPLQEMLEEIRRISQLEGLTQPLEGLQTMAV